MRQVIDIQADSSKNKVTVQLLHTPEKEDCITVYDVSGKILQQVKINRRNTAISFQPFVPGIYIIIVNSIKKTKALRYLRK